LQTTCAAAAQTGHALAARRRQPPGLQSSPRGRDVRCFGLHRRKMPAYIAFFSGCFSKVRGDWMPDKQLIPMQVPRTSTNPHISPANTSGIKYSCGICESATSKRRGKRRQLGSASERSSGAQRQMGGGDVAGTRRCRGGSYVVHRGRHCGRAVLAWVNARRGTTSPAAQLRGCACMTCPCCHDQQSRHRFSCR
jgi:hypothetical protein